jgi:ABC-type antimicrobial peptide transport system permease subunit
MFRNFFKVAVRNLSKNKFFTILNVLGLALGMSLCLLFIAFLAFLSRFDDFHANGDRIYRVTSQLYDKQENPKYASAPAVLAQNLQEFSGVEKVVRIHRSLYGNAVYGDKKIGLGGYFADPAFFEVFSFPLVKGNKATALSNPNSIVLVQEEATKIFGDKEPMGEMINIEGYGSFLVTGICKDLPKNSHMEFGALASYSTLTGQQKAVFLNEREGWKSYEGSFVYLLLNKNANQKNLSRRLNQIAKQRYAREKNKVAFRLQALNDITPGNEDLKDPIGSNWSYLTILITGLITLIVLIPACANYVNLAISQSLERMKEIGVRKVVGGRKKQIILQFIVESTTIVLLALMFSYVIYEIVRKDIFSSMVETSPMDLSPTWQTFVGFLLFALIVGAAAGLVPALYFSKLSPIIALKGKEIKTSGRSFFRKFILTLQFVISLGFIMAVVIMMQQYRYSVNYDLGFEQQHVLDVDLQNVDQQIFKNEFEKVPGVKRISMSSHVLGIETESERYIKSADGFDSVAVTSMSVDESFIPNMELTLLAGRDFGKNKFDNVGFIIVNEEFVKALKMEPGAAINELVRLNDSSEYRIAGVLKSFHYSGLKEAIAPFFFEYDPEKFRYANMKMEGGDGIGSLGEMEKLWKKIGGEGKFTAQLFSEKIKESYSFYIMIVKLWGFLGLLAITVACLGLLGTVSFNIKKRVKEIGVRKVLGATVKSLVILLSKDFVMLMTIAATITIPLIYFLFTHLLNNTQYYSIKIGFFEIVISLVIMMFLGLATILSQTVKAANANPVENLRTE